MSTMQLQPIIFKIKRNTDKSFENKITFDSAIALKQLNAKVSEIFKENIEEKMVDIFISNPISLNLTPIEELVKNNTITLTALKSFKGSDIICSFKTRKVLHPHTTHLICKNTKLHKQFYTFPCNEENTLNDLKLQIVDRMKEKILLLIKDPKNRNPFFKNENHRKEFFKYFTVQNLNLAADSSKYLKDDSDVKELFNFKNEKKLINTFVIKVIKPEKQTD